MKLWILKRKDTVGWDENAGFVVRAETSAEARKMASEDTACEAPKTWLRPATSTCKELKQGGRKRIILVDCWAS